MSTVRSFGRAAGAVGVAGALVLVATRPRPRTPPPARSYDLALFPAHLDLAEGTNTMASAGGCR